MIKSSIQAKLEERAERFEEVARLLSEPTIIANQNQFKALSKEYAALMPGAEAYKAYVDTSTELETLQVLIAEKDPDLAALAAEEMPKVTAQLVSLEEALYQHLIPKDPEDSRNVYLEVRAGTGGDEAAIFAGDLFRMYARYAETRGWQVETITTHHSEQGGYKEVVARVSGEGVYGVLKFESGTHRVQRVPQTESQGRVHTSACTVAVLPEVDEIEDVDINPDDLRVDTYRSSGAGGQHVNKTDSAIRITHIPSGMVVECQDERSQHKNRSKAMSLLKSRLLNAEQDKQRSEQAQTRKLQVGSGDRSERIRTYNFPQGRLTDHRIQLTLYQLDDIIAGDLAPVVEALQREHHATLLAELGQT